MLDTTFIFKSCSIMQNNIANKTTGVFSGLITSKTRIRVLMRLFLNPDQQIYLRGLSSEFGISPSQIKSELNQLENANLLKKQKVGRQNFFKANKSHPIFKELQSMVKKALGMDQIIESIITRLGNLEQALLIDDYAEGSVSSIWNHKPG